MIATYCRSVSRRSRKSQHQQALARLAQREADHRLAMAQAAEPEAALRSELEQAEGKFRDSPKRAGPDAIGAGADRRTLR
jgi:hypothetical protein